MTWLHQADLSVLPGKARRLAELRAAGLPVPPAVVVALGEPTSPDTAAVDAIAQLLQDGPVVVRSALAIEDAAHGSAAGLGRSALDCRSLDDVRRALRDLDDQRHDSWLRSYRGPQPDTARDHAIVQQQAARRRLVVAAVPTSGGCEIEVHDGQGEVLAHGAPPSFAGPLSGLDDPAAAALAKVIDQAIAVLPPTEHGLDLELVIRPDDTIALVQARPLAAPLHEGWPQFVAAVKQHGQADALHGELTLDAEHNPAPLSPAHAWLMDWLRAERPKAGDPTVLAGWLYVRTLPRELSGRSAASHAPTAVEVLRLLRDRLLPQARERLDQLRQRLDHQDTAGIARELRSATDAFLAMIDDYVGTLIPARRRAAGSLAHRRATTTTATPLTTLDRESFADVLPAQWDLASPSLAQLGAPTKAPATERPPLPDDEATAAILLGEWDDHLFALGLAPLRAWYLAAGRSLGLDDDVFLLSAPEVVEALVGAGPDLVAPTLIATRREQQAKFAELRPPLRIVDGHPVAQGRRARLRGIPFGPAHEGPLAPRRDLAELLRRPPSPGSIVTLPALTAQAALALQQLGVTAVCCEHGGPLSHAALMVRELGLSALIGCRDCTTLPEGAAARLDTLAGRLLVRP